MRAAVLILLLPLFASAQDADHQYHGQGYGYFGIGASAGNQVSSSAVQLVGFGGEGFLYKGLGLGGEVGYASWGGPYHRAWVPSVDFSYHFRGNVAHAKVDPFVYGGVSVYAPTMHDARGSAAGNAGVGVNQWFHPHAALRLEVGDTIESSTPNLGPGGHSLSFRVGVTFR